MKRIAVVSSCVLLASVAACASIRVVSATKQGGELALIGSRESAMEKARDEMARTCGSPTAYEIVEEGEVGFQNDAGGQDPKEWRVHYECRTADAGAQVADAGEVAADGSAAGGTSQTPDVHAGAQSRDMHTVIVRF
jgi:hypothetical protein